MTDWDSYPKAIKSQLWGTEELEAHDPNPLWCSKFTGEVIHHPRVNDQAAYDEYLINPGFSTAKFIENRYAGLKKTSTRNAASVTYHPKHKT